MSALFLYGLFGGFYSPPEGESPMQAGMHNPPDYDEMIAEFERERGRVKSRKEESSSHTDTECYHYTEAGVEKIAWAGTEEYKLIQEAIRRR
jgi:hypothetical protein